MGTGTMRQEQAAATKAKLLDSAQKMFAANGYEGTSIRMINRNANLADGLLYHYFPGGKKEIFQAVIANKISEIMDSLKYKIDVERNASLPLKDILEAFYTNFMDIIEQHMDIIRIITRENAANEFVTKEQMKELLGNRPCWISEVLRRKYEKGEVKELDFDAAAMMVSAVIMNHVFVKVLQIGVSQIEDYENRQRLIDYQVNSFLK